MKKDKNRKKPINPYTGEKEPAAEDAYEIIEVVPVDSGTRDGENYLLMNETSMDALTADEDADAIADRSASYTEDEVIEDHFEDRQQLATGGRDALKDELENYHSKSPELSGGDLDADWQSASQSGEETVGGTVPTPDQDTVDELGEAVGLDYEYDEPLESREKFLERDRERWELDPKSAETRDSAALDEISEAEEDNMESGSS